MYISFRSPSLHDIASEGLAALLTIRMQYYTRSRHCFSITPTDNASQVFVSLCSRYEGVLSPIESSVKIVL